MLIRLLGGLRVEHEGSPVGVSGAMQLAVLFRLAVDAGTAVSYRAIAEDVWGADLPENSRGALQSIVSRLRSQLPAGSIESEPGGYRLAVARADVDALVFEDTVAAALAASDSADARRLATEALALWAGEPWVPSPEFDWFQTDLRRDRAAALALGGVALPAGDAGSRIPAPLTGIIGRERELALVADQLAVSRLVTVIGAGGAGKTRLALEAAAQVPGAVLVELASAGPEELVAAVLAATGRELRTGAESTTHRERMIEALAGRPVLLVLDNCEHVIEEAARLVDDLLGSLRTLRVLATSREPLGVPGEAFVMVGPLAHPADRELDSSDLLAYPAVRLFRERAIAARAHDLVPEELAVAARICSRLDGLPLALELAAARLRTMSLEEVLSGLDHRFALLTGGLRTALPRHQTLRAMVDWSWSLLTADEQVALAWSAVYPAGIDAAEASEIAVSMGLASAAPLDSLVDRSLLQRTRGRYRALETIREYGIEKLADRGELVSARQAQAQWCAARALEIDALLRGPRIHEAIAWFDREEDNLVAALRYAAGAPLPECMMDLVLGCGWYWTIRDREDDARTWFAAALPLAERVDSDMARLVTLLAPVMSAFSGTLDADPAGSEARVLEALSDLGDLPVSAGSHDLLQALPPLLRAFGMAGREPGWVYRAHPPTGEELGLDPWPTAMLHVVRAAMAQNRGDVVELGVESQLTCQQFGEIGDLWGLALAQQMRAEWLTVAGQLDGALTYSEASTENMRQITSSWDLAQQQALAVTIMLRQGRVDDARARAALLAAQAEETGNVRTILQAQVVGLQVALHERDIARSLGYIALFDELVREWTWMPRQLSAVIAVSRARLAGQRGQWGLAEAHLREAVELALETQDHPIIAAVARQAGLLALERGDLHEALRALDLANAIIGTEDATAVESVIIEGAARDAGIGRPDTVVPNRPMALEALKGLAAG